MRTPSHRGENDARALVATDAAAYKGARPFRLPPSTEHPTRHSALVNAPAQERKHHFVHAAKPSGHRERVFRRASQISIPGARRAGGIQRTAGSSGPGACAHDAADAGLPMMIEYSSRLIRPVDLPGRPSSSTWQRPHLSRHLRALPNTLRTQQPGTKIRRHHTKLNRRAKSSRASTAKVCITSPSDRPADVWADVAHSWAASACGATPQLEGGLVVAETCRVPTPRTPSARRRRVQALRWGWLRPGAGQSAR